MRRLVVILVLAIVAAAAGFALVTARHASEERALATASGADLAWLRTEFKLDDNQFAAIRALHEAYGPACTKHCADVLAAQKQLEALRANHADAAAISAAERALSDVQAVCNNATREHVRDVAALMPRGEGARYLAMIEPHLAQTPHDPALRDGMRH
jgi:hypothetical protein